MTILDRCRHQIQLEGDVSNSWNGNITTVITAEAPNQNEAAQDSVTIDVTFFYCPEVRYDAAWSPGTRDGTSCVGAS